MLHNRVEVFEKHLIDIYNSLCSYTRRISRLRDEGDILSSQIFNFSQAEKLNTTMKVSFENFAETFAELQDHRHSQVLIYDNQLFLLLLYFSIDSKT